MTRAIGTLGRCGDSPDSADGCRRLPFGRPSRRTRKAAARRRLSSLLFIDEIDEIDDAVKHAKDAPAEYNQLRPHEAVARNRPQGDRKTAAPRCRPLG